MHSSPRPKAWPTLVAHPRQGHLWSPRPGLRYPACKDRTTGHAAAMLANAHRPFNFDLGETADMLRDTVQSFAQAEIAPRADEIDRSNQFPRDLWPRMGELGLHGITVEEEFGGSG